MDKLPICCGQGIAPYCPSCGSGEYLHNEDGNENNFCGQCGCPLDWSEMYNEDAERIEEKFKCVDCAEYCRSADKETEGVCKAKGVHVRRSKPACKKHFRKAMHIWGEKEHGDGEINKMKSKTWRWTDMQELEKILEEIDQEVKEYMEIDFGDEYNAGIKDMAKMAKKIIRKYMNDGWIPVEERLPEVGEYVLGTTKSGEVLIYRYGWNSPHSKKMFFHLCGAAADVIAWRPLPEPYRVERSRE